MAARDARSLKLWVLCALCFSFSFCASGVEAEKISLTRQTRLVTLFAGSSFSGNYFSIEGIYRSCYNILHDSEVGSIMLEKGTTYCEIWGVEECGEEGDGKDKPQAIFGPIPTLSSDGVGEAKDEMKRDTIKIAEVKSLRCFKSVIGKPTE